MPSKDKTNNREAIACPNEDDRAVEQAFLRLGNLLAEIANDVARREARCDQAPEKDHASGD